MAPAGFWSQMRNCSVMFCSLCFMLFCVASLMIQHESFHLNWKDRFIMLSNNCCLVHILREVCVQMHEGLLHELSKYCQTSLKLNITITHLAVGCFMNIFCSIFLALNGEIYTIKGDFILFTSSVFCFTPCLCFSMLTVSACCHFCNLNSMDLWKRSTL